MEKKQLAFFLVFIVLMVAGMTWYHHETPSPYDAKAFFGE
tara:strand:- start:3045 stop:3164 length:120 start_codon:yes stop_codon:yes gene_type:complete